MLDKTRTNNFINGLKKQGIVAVIFLHLAVSLLVFLILYACNLIHILPGNKNVLNWDALWYWSVAHSGYQFIVGLPCNMAFSPLFPYLWKLSHLPPIFICLFNAVIFYVSFAFLLKGKTLPHIFVLLLLAIPSFVFFYLPYTEAVFFLFGVILLKGYENRSVTLKIISFLGISLTRSVSLIFIPAILITELYAYRPGDGNAKKWWNIAWYILSCLTGLVLTALVQWYQTGKWFYFLGIQEFWGRHWIIPKLPLTTYNPSTLLGMEAIGFIVGAIAVYYCIKWLVLMIPQTKNPTAPVVEFNKAVYFSALYLSAIFILDTFFTFNWHNAGNIWSINRHLLCTPFAVIFMLWLYNNIHRSKIDAWVIGGMVVAGIFITGVYQYKTMLAYYLVFFLSLAILKYFPAKKNYLLIAYFISLLLQIHFFENFLNNVFIG